MLAHVRARRARYPGGSGEFSRAHRRAVLRSKRSGRGLAWASVDAAESRFEEFRQRWGETYPAMIAVWDRASPEFVPFLTFPVELRKIVYTTDDIVNPSGRCVDDLLAPLFDAHVRATPPTCRFHLRHRRSRGPRRGRFHRGCKLRRLSHRARPGSQPRPRGCPGPLHSRRASRDRAIRRRHRHAQPRNVATALEAFENADGYTASPVRITWGRRPLRGASDPSMGLAASPVHYVSDNALSGNARSADGALQSLLGSLEELGCDAYARFHLGVGDRSRAV